MKKIILLLFRSLGYEIRRIKSRSIIIESRPNGFERDEEGYDKVWSNQAYLEQYDRVHKEGYNSLVEFLIGSNVMDKALSLADIGCGPGNLINMIEKKWPNMRLFGFDFSINAINVARLKVPSAIFNTHDIYKPLNDQFDIVLCCETLEHLLYPAKALENVLSATRQVCILTVPDGRMDTYQGHINFWSEESWGCFLQTWIKSWEVSISHTRTGLIALMIKRN
jgi:SAM-dependent methyltransferase